MPRIILFSSLLITGLVGAQFLPQLFDENLWLTHKIIVFLSMIGLSYIMINVGLEFDLEKSKIRQYGWDYVVAITTATFPWLLAALYLMFIIVPHSFWQSSEAWKEILIIARFAAPTATGILFAMLIAIGLSKTWTFKKTRLLAIFDDLDTILLMVLIKIVIIGIAWQLMFIVSIMLSLLITGWFFLHRLRIPLSWTWILFYGFIIAGTSELIYWFTKNIDYQVPVHLEVLLPAFILGCIAKQQTSKHTADKQEQKATLIISASFMLLVGLSMPALFNQLPTKATSITAGLSTLSNSSVAFHVLVLTLLINIGKMFPAFCYRKEATLKERIAVAICMCPRGEVGAGIILLSLSYGIGGSVVTICILTLTLNLVLTPFFILIINTLLKNKPAKKNALLRA